MPKYFGDFLRDSLPISIRPDRSLRAIRVVPWEEKDEPSAGMVTAVGDVATVADNVAGIRLDGLVWLRW
jgi:hypothetical protein